MRFVGGEGPTPCNVMVIGEGPGWEEEKTGRPSAGKSGKELDRYLWRNLYLGRDQVYVTNIVKYRTSDQDDDPTPEEMKRDELILRKEIRDVNPTFILTLGRISTRHFLGDVDMDVVHGIPHVLSTGVCVLPCFHPVAGLHNTESQALIQYDFEIAAKVISGELEPVTPEDVYLKPIYDTTVCETVWVDDVGVDTEGSIARPWCTTFSADPGYATLSKKPAYVYHAVLHNSLHDLPILRALNVTFDRFDDTMVMAYLLCIEPQGLKQLAKRHCGMNMHSYTDLTDPYRLKKQTAYLSEVLKCLDNLSLQERLTPLGTAPKKARTRKKGGRRSKPISRRK